LYYYKALAVYPGTIQKQNYFSFFVKRNRFPYLTLLRVGFTMPIMLPLLR